MQVTTHPPEVERDWGDCRLPEDCLAVMCAEHMQSHTAMPSVGTNTANKRVNAHIVYMLDTKWSVHRGIICNSSKCKRLPKCLPTGWVTTVIFSPTPTCDTDSHTHATVMRVNHAVITDESTSILYAEKRKPNTSVNTVCF